MSDADASYIRILASTARNRTCSNASPEHEGPAFEVEASQEAEEGPRVERRQARVGLAPQDEVHEDEEAGGDAQEGPEGGAGAREGGPQGGHAEDARDDDVPEAEEHGG